MEICTISPADHAAFVAFLDAGMRPAQAPTRAADDFPVILAPANLAAMHAIRDDSGFLAGLATLTRPCLTSAGEVLVAGIGSVVTRPDRRGEGLSSSLQRVVVDHLAAAGIPLAVLWTDQPEIYAGRGFQAAGWEYHLDLGGLSAAVPWPDDADWLVLDGRHADDLAALYAAHPLRTLREATDHRALYSMPGTRIRGLARGGRLLASACCGKGEDFPDYVAEWAGPADLALAVLARVAAEGLARRALTPAGREDLLQLAVQRGAGLAAAPSGQWAVLRPDLLAAVVGPVAPGRERDPRAWLGYLDDGGAVVPGRLQLGIWGLDSV